MTELSDEGKIQHVVNFLGTENLSHEEKVEFLRKHEGYTDDIINAGIKQFKIGCISLPKLEDCESLNEERKQKRLENFKLDFKKVVAPLFIRTIKQALIQYEAGPNNKKISFEYAPSSLSMQNYENYMGDCRMGEYYQQFALHTINEQLKETDWRITKIKDSKTRLQWRRRFKITVVHNTYEPPPKKRCQIS